MNAELAAALAALEPELGLPESEAISLSGGITNRNFKIRLDGRDVVVRLPGKDTELLGIDRGAERAATAAAARLRLGPDVVAFLREPPCLVTRFIDARPVEADELRGPLLDEAAHALRALHDAPGLPSVFDCFAVVEAYHATAAANGVAVPGDYAALARAATAIHAALVGPEHGPVPCHNDYLTANFLHDGRRLRIVDWEYAGMGDRYFDLGNFAVNNGFDDDEDRALLEAYWQQPVTPQRFACLKLMRIMSDFREGMWGVVQSGISSLDFDFAAYAEEHLTRVAAGLADARVPTWLEDARGDQS